MSVTLSSRGRSGTVQKGIRVTTNDPDNKQITLTCKGNVISAFNGQAPKANFGRIKRDQGPQTKTIRLSAGDGGPIKPEVGVITREGVTAEIREIDPGKIYDLDVTISPPWPNGRLVASLDLKTGLAKSPAEKVKVNAQIEPRVQAAPSQFTVMQKGNKGTEIRARLLWDKEGLEKAVTASVNDSNLKVRIEQTDQGHQEVVLVIPEGYVGPGRRPTVTVNTDDKEVPSFTVPIRYKRKPRGGSPGATLTHSRRRAPASPKALPVKGKKPTTKARQPSAIKPAPKDKAAEGSKTPSKTAAPKKD